MTARWRRKKYLCLHAKKESGDQEWTCGIDLCSLPVLLDCCESCEKYLGRDRGLGDTIKRAAEALGAKTCGGCQGRREALNRLTRKLYDSGDEGRSET